MRMFKRRARILFIGGESAVTASELANDLGGCWLEARAQSIESLNAGAFAPQATQGACHWADTVILLDQGGAGSELWLPQHTQTQCRRWPLSGLGGCERAFNAELRRRVSGLIGGLRLLAGSSGAPPV